MAKFIKDPNRTQLGPPINTLVTIVIHFYIAFLELTKHEKQSSQTS